MTSLIPKFNLLYYKHLVDISVYNFLDLFESSFIKDKKTGTYVMSEALSYSKLKTIFFELVLSELKNIIEKYDPCSPKYFIIINGCIPKDNLLYKLKNSQYFPAKLSKLIESSNIKYFIKEKGIKVNIEMFNDIFADIFNMFFKNIKHLGKEYKKNVFFV